MTEGIQQLVAEVAQVTGAPLPALMEDDAPVLRDEALAANEAESFYLVGLIGGKEVGKSALVNALVGEQITESTSFGPGTEQVVAYVHQGQAAPVKALLEREAPGRYRIVVHSILRLHRQVLLDLPDVDSQYCDHVELTRRMLRHMLFPIWIQSIEKYADQQPQKLLAAVAAGNDPANFLFCLNKADQVGGYRVSGIGSSKTDPSLDPKPDTLNPIEELREDFAARIARTLGVSFTPRVFVISAIKPDGFDLPDLRERLSQQKPAETVKQSIALAGRQRERSMLNWLDDQRLPERVARLARLGREAEELAASRLSVPLMEVVLPRVLDDPAHRAAMVDEAMNARVARWPILNVLHTLALPLTSLWRRNMGAAGGGATAESLIDGYATIGGRSLNATVMATFALLQQTHPMIGTMYARQRLWEEIPASAAADELRGTLAGVLRRQRAAATARFGRSNPLMTLMRWLLTVGAVLWFPIVQPVLERVLLRETMGQSARGALLLLVQLLGATYLLKSAAFLLIWFAVLWLILRWDTQRRVSRMLASWQAIEADGEEDATLSPSAAALAWVDELLDPIRAARQREEALVQRAESLRKQLDKPAA
jgi:hypothetical protein